MKSTKISFLGLFGQQNLGNECTLQAIVFNARKYIPNLEISCICTGPGDTLKRHNIPAFPISYHYAGGYHSRVSQGHSHRPIGLLRKISIRVPMELLDWLKAFRYLKGRQMLVVPGTGFLSDYTTRSLGWPYFIFKWSVIAKLCRCKLLFVSVGAGPLFRPLSKWFIKRALSLADYRSYRDSFTKQCLENIGFATNNDQVYPDLAFSLPEDMFLESKSSDEERSIIGIGLKDYYGKLGNANEGGEAKYDSFINKLATFVGWLIEHGYIVRLLVGDVLYDGSVKQDLIDLLEKHGPKYKDDQIINEPIFSVEQLLSQLVTTDIVVSPRFHNIILALMLNKPALSLSYHEKFAFLMAGVGLADYCQDIDRLDIARLIEQVVELRKNTEKVRLQIKQKVREYRNVLDEQYKFIFNCI
jgi:polysaccharide pyruvyl transferase WcaK-like protein